MENTQRCGGSTKQTVHRRRGVGPGYKNIIRHWRMIISTWRSRMNLALGIRIQFVIDVWLYLRDEVEWSTILAESIYLWRHNCIHFNHPDDDPTGKSKRSFYESIVWDRRPDRYAEIRAWWLSDPIFRWLSSHEIAVAVDPVRVAFVPYGCVHTEDNVRTRNDRRTVGRIERQLNLFGGGKRISLVLQMWLTVTKQKENNWITNARALQQKE